MIFQQFLFIIVIFGSWGIMSETAPPTQTQRPAFLIRTGRSRIKITDPAAMRRMTSSLPPLPILNGRSIPVNRRLSEVRSLFGCGEDKGRCFFGLFGGGGGGSGEDESRDGYYGPTAQGRPAPFFTPSPIILPQYMDYYEVCDEIYDPYNDEYVEDCSTFPDYYYRR